MIYDADGSADTNPALFTEMEQAGIQVVVQPSGILYNHLTHRKLIVIDGSTGFLGGMNVGDDYQYTWQDVDAEVTGLGVADLQQTFLQQWTVDTGGPISSSDQALLFPTLTPAASNGETCESSAHGPVGRERKAGLPAGDRDGHQEHRHRRSVFYRPGRHECPLCRGRGAECQVTVVFPQTNDEVLDQLAERYDYNELLSAGVKIYEYNGRPMAHEKIATFDGTISTIGSSNLDARSLINNDEVNVWSSDPSVAADLNQNLFAQDITQSVQITSHNATGLEAVEENFAHDITPLI